MQNRLNLHQKLSDQSFKKLHFQKILQDESGESLEVADPCASRALIALMDMYAVLGGAASHYGGPAALAELMSATHGYMFNEAKKAKKPWYEMFHFVNDAGHCENGLYALKANYQMSNLNLNDLKKFRSIDSPLTGHGEVHCFPEGVFISNGPLGSGLPQAQGLALADRQAKIQRTTISVLSDGAAMEGEAKESFAAIPGLASRGKLAPFVLIISDNNTKLSGRIDADSFSMQPTFKSLESLGWKVIQLEEGNNLLECFKCISKAIKAAEANPNQPIAIHARTIKGIGHKKSADSSSGGHGFPLKSPTELPALLSEIYDSKEYPQLFNEWIRELVEIEEKLKSQGSKESGEKIQKGVSKALIRAKSLGFPIISITSDLPGSTGVAEFRKQFPNESIDVGVAESNMISVAAGFSKIGYIPVVDTFAQFGVTKGSLPLTMAALSEAPLIAIFSHTGFQDAADGASHQALNYLSMVAGIPHVKVHALTCSAEAESLVFQAIEETAKERQSGKNTHTHVFFLGRENFPPHFGVPSYKLYSPQIVYPDRPLLSEDSQSPSAIGILAPGSMLDQALEAAYKLKEKGLKILVINPSCLNYFDLDFYKSVYVACKGRFVVVEDHQAIGGFAALFSHFMSESKMPIQLKSLAVRGEFGRSAYQAKELYRLHRMDSESIIKACLDF